MRTIKKVFITVACPAKRGLSVFLVSALMLLLCAAPAMAWRSELYPADWQPPTNGAVDFQTDKLIQDFSCAGYKAGEAPLPSVSGPVFTVTQPPYNADNSGTNDATSAIQAAINAAQTAVSYTHLTLPTILRV